MKRNKIVARFKDGTLMKGNTNNFSPDKNDFHIEPSNGGIVKVEVEKLKALFFVKDFEGNKSRDDLYKDVVPGGGRKVQVKFKDGELLIGYSQGYAPYRFGFFILPADTQNNNERIFILNSAISEVTFLLILNLNWCQINIFLSLSLVRATIFLKTIAREQKYRKYIFLFS